MKNNKRTFARFIFTYFAIIILVLTSLSPIYIALNRSMHENVSQSILNYAQNAARELESKEELLLYTARNVYKDPELLNLYHNDEVSDESLLFYRMSQLQKRLQLYFKNISGIKDVMVYIPKFDYVLTQQYIFRTRSQFYQSIQSSAYGSEDWLEQVSQGGFSVSTTADVLTDHLNASNSYSVINHFFIFPMAGDYSIKLLVAVSLDSQAVSNQFLLPEIADQARVVITDSDGSFLADSEPDNTGSRLNEKDSDFNDVSFTGTDGKNFTIKIDRSYFNTRRLETLKLIIRNIGLTLILSACASFYFAWRHSSPIERILDIVRKANASDDSILQLAQLEDGVINMASEICQCKRTIKDLDSIVNNSLLERLFFGDFSSPKLQASFMQYYGSMPSECFVLVFDFEDPDNGELPEGEILEGFHLLQKNVYVSYKYNRRLYCVAETSEDISKAVESILKNIREGGYKVIKAGISNKITGLSSIREGTRQAERRLNSGLHLQGIYLLTHTHSSKAVSNPLSLDSLNLLSRALLVWDRQTSDKALQDIFTQLEAKKPDSIEYRQIFFSLRSVYSIIIDQFIQNIEKTGITVGEELFLPNDLDEYNLQAIQATFTDLNAAMHKYYQQYTEKKSQIRGFDILDYINENFRDPNLCANSIAEHFNISEKYVFQLIKKACGETLNDKISFLRVQEGIRLLEQTDMTVSEIADAVGFTSSNSMYKVFMRVNGVSPSSYRKTK